MKLELHWGIKKALKRAKIYTDTHLVLATLRILHKYLYAHLVHHYGADYRWGEDKSQNLDKEHYTLGYGEFHKAMIRNLRPKRILCIGSMYGFIPFMMAQACEEQEFGHVDFVDAGYDFHTDTTLPHFYGEGFWKKDESKDHFSYLLKNHQAYLTTHLMHSRSFAQTHSTRKYGYIYLDGDRSFKGLTQDISMFWPMLEIGGFLVIHGIHLKHSGHGITFEAWKVWEKLKKLPHSFEISNHHTSIGGIQKSRTNSTVL